MTYAPIYPRTVSKNALATVKQMFTAMKTFQVENGNYGGCKGIGGTDGTW